MLKFIGQFFMILDYFFLNKNSANAKSLLVFISRPSSSVVYKSKVGTSMTSSFFDINFVGRILIAKLSFITSGRF